ncbi:IS481 family transposase, partial [Methylobacterium oxalidis]
LRGFNVAYNGRRQRVLNGLSPEMVLRQRLEADPVLVNPAYKPPGPSLIKHALRIVADANEVSHPDS